MNPQSADDSNNPVQPASPDADGYYDEQNESNEDLDLSFLDEEETEK